MQETLTEQTQDALLPALRYLYEEISPSLIDWDDREIERDGETITVRAPVQWSDNAVRIFASKYMRRGGVPQHTEPRGDLFLDSKMPEWLYPRQAGRHAKSGPETSIAQVLSRIVGHWTFTAWQENLFDRDPGALALFHEVCFGLMARQWFAPNSPQFFNTGLWWAYGIEGGKTGYRWPQTSACFILNVEDNLVEKEGIYETLSREGTIFKYGSGSGANFSRIRGKGALLSSGGKSSGLLSFLKVLDHAAGAIKSGGTTRRAAKMVVVDAEHADAMEFAGVKDREEQKIRMLQLGACYYDENGDPKDWDRDLLRSLGGDWETEAHDTVGFQNANHSIRWTDEQVRAALRGKHAPQNPEDERYAALWDEMVRAAHACGDPGIQFHDTCNRWHTIPKAGPQRATNPCSEFSFIDNSACNLASLNLLAFYDIDKRRFQTAHFAAAVAVVTTVLDLTVSMSSYPTPEIVENSHKYRPLGLGYTNLGGLLMAMGLPYDSDRGRQIAALVTALMHGHAWRTSQDLAGRFGNFHDYVLHADDVKRVLDQHKDHVDMLGDEIDVVDEAGGRWASEGREAARHLLKAVREVYREGIDPNAGLRNAQLTLLAPTGTISFMMDCATTGIEPDFALKKTKKLAGGGELVTTNGVIPETLSRLGYGEDEQSLLLKTLVAEGDTAFLQAVDADDRPVFATANQVHWRDHIRMMAAVQPYLSGAMSKTVNMPATATEQDVHDAYLMAFNHGLKALAIFRDGCKTSQPLSQDGETPPADAAREDKVEVVEIQQKERQRHKLPDWRRGTTVKAKIGGHTVYLRTGEYEDGRIGEVFLTIAKAGSDLRAYLDALAVSLSIGLQYGVPLEEYVDAFRDTKCEPSGLVQGVGTVKFCSSVLDWAVRTLLVLASPSASGAVLANASEDRVLKDIDPSDGVHDSEVRESVAKAEGTSESGDCCPECKGFTLQRTGSCLTCWNCGWNGGCS